jgi:dolichol kinase
MHVGTAAVLLAVPLASWTTLRFVLAVLVVTGIAVDFARIKFPVFGAVVQRWFPVLREKEQMRLSGATWLWMGYALAGCFPPTAPAAGILVGAVADPAGSLVGSWGREPGRKTVRGSITVLVVAAGLLLLLGFPVVTAAVGSLVAAVLERWSRPLNDNLVVAPAVALGVWFAT